MLWKLSSCSFVIFSSFVACCGLVVGGACCEELFVFEVAPKTLEDSFEKALEGVLYALV